MGDGDNLGIRHTGLSRLAGDRRHELEKGELVHDDIDSDGHVLDLGVVALENIHEGDAGGREIIVGQGDDQFSIVVDAATEPAGELLDEIDNDKASCDDVQKHTGEFSLTDIEDAELGDFDVVDALGNVSRTVSGEEPAEEEPEEPLVTERERFARMDDEQKQAAIDLQAARKEEEDSREQSLINAEKARRLDILSHIEQISTAVHRELWTTRVFKAEDIRLNVGTIVAALVAERAKGYQQYGEDPDYLVSLPSTTSSTDSPNAPESLVEHVVENSRGTTAGKAFLKTLLTSAPALLVPSIETKVAEKIEKRYIENNKKISKIKRKVGIQELLYSLTDEDAWALLEESFVERARELSIKSHEFFFRSIKPNPNSKSGIEHDMLHDFKGMITVAQLQEGRDYGIKKAGSDEVGYISNPLDFKRPLTDEELAKVTHEEVSGFPRRVYRDESTGQWYRNHAVDVIVELAGGNYGTIAGLKTADRKSFVAITNASIDASKTTPEYEGGYLSVFYDSHAPTYDPMADQEEVVVLDNEIFLPEDMSNDRTDTGSMTWKVRCWQLTPTGYNLVTTALNALREKGNSPVLAFHDPRHGIYEAHMDQVVRGESREKSLREIDRIRRETEERLRRATEDVISGVQPDDLPGLPAPILDGPGLRSPWLPVDSYALPARDRQILDIESAVGDESDSD